MGVQDARLLLELNLFYIIKHFCVYASFAQNAHLYKKN
jgi:hypothetical protein